MAAPAVQFDRSDPECNTSNREDKVAACTAGCSVCQTLSNVCCRHQCCCSGPETVVAPDIEVQSQGTKQSLCLCCGPVCFSFWSPKLVKKGDSNTVDLVRKLQPTTSRHTIAARGTLEC